MGGFIIQFLKDGGGVQDADLLFLKSYEFQDPALGEIRGRAIRGGKDFLESVVEEVHNALREDADGRGFERDLDQSIVFFIGESPGGAKFYSDVDDRQYFIAKIRESEDMPGGVGEGGDLADGENRDEIAQGEPVQPIGQLGDEGALLICRRLEIQVLKVGQLRKFCFHGTIINKKMVTIQRLFLFPNGDIYFSFGVERLGLQIP